MITEKLNTIELFEAYDDISLQLSKLVAAFTEENFNVIPFANSWTASQVCEHIIKTNKSIAHALSKKGATTEREPDQRVIELKEILLDFTRKFQAPEFVIPTKSDYKKEVFFQDLKESMEGIKALSKTINVSEMIIVPGFGELTKLELLHFIVYHAQRHIIQLKNVRASFANTGTVVV